MTEDLRTILESGAVSAARALIGWRLYAKEPDGTLTGGTIIETEAYTQEDAASHSYRGQTPRTEVMFGPAGGIYIYFTYGMHWCMNIVTGKPGHGEAVLLRALSPDKGIAVMSSRRGKSPESKLTDGPAKLCQALNITGEDNGSVLGKSRIIIECPLEKLKVHATKRIGIKNNTHRLWRFIALDGSNPV